MNLALQGGLDIFSKAINDTKKHKITHIAVKDESTNTVVTKLRSEYVADKYELYFADEPKTYASQKEAFAAALQDRPF